MNDERFSAAADPELRRALLFARAQPEPFTVDDAADALGVHRNVARARLDRLAAAGFLRSFFERRTGRTGPGAGRPSKVYEVAPETEALEFPERRLADLVVVLAERLDEEALWAAGADYGRALAARAGLRPLRSVRRGLERLCSGIGSLGFQASLVELDKNRATIASPTCPLRPLVVQRPEAIPLDHGMWSGLVECAVAGARAEGVECETRNCLDDHSSCRIALRLRYEASSSGSTTSR